MQAAEPTFAADHTADKAKYAASPPAMAGFQHVEDLFKAGDLNEDFWVAKFDDGVRMVATGEAAHYPMLTFALGNIQQNFPDNVAVVGFFAQPGPEAAKNGLTVWMPLAQHIPACSPNQDASDVLASVIYKQYQAGFYGLATAGNVILFLLIALIILPLTFWFNKREVEIPKALDEAAIIDGAKPLQVFCKVIRPLLKPVTVTLIVVQSIAIFNDFTNPLYYLPGKETVTVQLTLFNFQGQFDAAGPPCCG